MNIFNKLLSIEPAPSSVVASIIHAIYGSAAWIIPGRKARRQISRILYLSNTVNNGIFSVKRTRSVEPRCVIAINPGEPLMTLYLKSPQQQFARCHPGHSGPFTKTTSPYPLPHHSRRGTNSLALSQHVWKPHGLQAHITQFTPGLGNPYVNN